MQPLLWALIEDLSSHYYRYGQRCKEAIIVGMSRGFKKPVLRAWPEDTYIASIVTISMGPCITIIIICIARGVYTASIKIMSRGNCIAIIMGMARGFYIASIIIMYIGVYIAIIVDMARDFYAVFIMGTARMFFLDCIMGMAREDKNPLFCAWP